MPLFESEKGAPLLFILGVIGLYYLLRKTARKILWPQTGAKPDHQKIRSVVRKIIYGIALLIGLAAGYFIYDLTQAKQMAADACRLATPGMLSGRVLVEISRRRITKSFAALNMFWSCRKEAWAVITAP